VLAIDKNQKRSDAEPPLRWVAAATYPLIARWRHRLPGGTPAAECDALTGSESVAEPNFLGESSDPPGREHRKKVGVARGKLVSPVKRALRPRAEEQCDAPGRIRTSDLALRRRALYPLSYGRVGRP
jgi:hypothetical protein